jgi:hypothetical protein
MPMSISVLGGWVELRKTTEAEMSDIIGDLVDENIEEIRYIRSKQQAMKLHGFETRVVGPFQQGHYIKFRHESPVEEDHQIKYRWSWYPIDKFLKVWGHIGRSELHGINNKIR